MDEFYSLTDENADFDISTSDAAKKDKTVKEEDENWKRYVESAWWWGWYD